MSTAFFKTHDNVLSYELIRSARRKTIGLQVKNAKIIVRAPHYVDETFIRDFIDNKSSWLRSKVALQLAQSPVETLTFKHGSSVLIAGKHKEIELSFGSQECVSVCEKYIHITILSRFKKHREDEKKVSSLIKNRLEKWFLSETTHYIEGRINTFSSLLKLVPTKIKIRRYKSRWGSCNSRHELSFNYLLAMCPLWVVDYVIIHELCHIKHLNHSPKFWSLVHNYCNDVQEAKMWLKKNNRSLYWG